MKHCKLQNYYDTEENFLTIELDENLTPQQNAQRYFKKYNKGKCIRICSRTAKSNQKELDYLESVLYNLDEAILLRVWRKYAKNLKNRVIYERLTNERKTL